MNKMRCAADDYNYICHISAKEFLGLKFDKAAVVKISNFHEIAPNVTYSQKL